ncbi:predicted protein [Plenodomus lingam JN3]|uniref:Predicted protein n=1 Tax=Leptosphaeria maculans (strain JN3 / isolate v23.1.3 / race Av1-4-5-6-7-8) TaxID=985895 RepID=E4ZTP2_LEPMJ|nr:predicted protein [Plenodomus lingam JN3]CBX94898.1 predicted protein [Plenodomus lingam JN3]
MAGVRKKCVIHEPVLQRAPRVATRPRQAWLLGLRRCGGAGVNFTQACSGEDAIGHISTSAISSPSRGGAGAETKSDVAPWPPTWHMLLEIGRMLSSDLGTPGSRNFNTKAPNPKTCKMRPAGSGP